jgi:translation elongation factor EF-Ts
MANIDAKTVNDLRLETGAGMDCKRALEESAATRPRPRRSSARGLEKADNIAAVARGGPKEGRIGTYVH